MRGKSDKSHDKVFLLGAGGFLGKAFLQSLLNDRSEVFTLSRSDSEANVVGHFKGDVFDGNFLKSALHKVKPTVVVNFVGSSDSSLSLSELTHINTRVLALWHQVCPKLDVLEQKFLTMGSAAEYGKASQPYLGEMDICEPVSPYGLAKMAQTKLATELTASHGARISVVRPFNLMGAGTPPTLISEKIRLRVDELGMNDDLILDDPEMERDFIDVEDFSDALKGLMASDGPSGIYNICRGEVVNLGDLGEAYLEASGRRGAVLQSENPSFRSDLRRAIGSCSRLKNATGWAPQTSLLQSAIRQQMAFR